MSPITVFVADDEAHCRKEISELISAHSELELKATALTGQEALDILSRESFDLAFLDIGMPELTGLEVVQELKQQSAALPYIIFTTAFPQHGAQAYNLGAVDYMIKPLSKRRFAQAMEKFQIYSQGNAKSSDQFSSKLEQNFGLTGREIEICRLIHQGLVREELQDKLCCSPGTLKTHLAHIYEKTGLTKAGDTGRQDKFSRLLYLLFTL